MNATKKVDADGYFLKKLQTLPPDRNEQERYFSVRWLTRKNVTSNEKGGNTFSLHTRKFNFRSYYELLQQ